MNIGAELLLSITVNVVAVSYFVGVQSANQKKIEESMAMIREHFKENLDELKTHFQDKFDTLEKKQDKHNNLIERMVVVEQTTKSAHKRIDDISEVVHE